MEEEEIDAETGDIRNENPPIVKNSFLLATQLLQAYGWSLLGLAVAGYIVYTRILVPWLARLERSREDVAAKKYDTNSFVEREQRMMAARLRMQQQQDELSQQFRDREAEREEARRAQKIEEYNAFVQGKSSKAPPVNKTTKAVLSKPKPKSSLRPDDYNPLMGPGGGSCYRPSRSSGAGGDG